MQRVAGAGILALAVLCWGCRDRGSAAPAVGRPPDRVTTANGAGETPPNTRASDPVNASAGSSRRPEGPECAGVVTFNTGDLPDWPCYDLPLEFTFDAPQVPARILGPFAAGDISAGPSVDSSPASGGAKP